jgi:DNA replication and repair protein RecF
VTFSTITQAPRILRLQLSEFRNYEDLDITTDAQFVVFSGDNGAGKTNLLEAVSLFCAGRGLRRADLGTMARKNGTNSWAVSLEIQGNLGEAQLGTGTLGADQPRKCRIDRSPVSSASAFADHLRVIWLTPAQDGLFTGSAGDRRRFLDRLVLAVDPNHGSRVSALERALRSRNKLLENAQFDANWASSIEREIAEIGVCVAAARAETVARLRALIARQRDETSPFPHADIMLNGALEIKLAQEPASQVEDWFRDELSRTRGRDRAAGRTLTGPQMSDLTVMHGPKSAPAGQCSTGEQKALLIGLILAHSQLVHEMTGIIPIMLLDEVAAHLDPKRRAGLYELLRHLGGQVFMTGTDASLFETLGTDSLKLSVSAGCVSNNTSKAA